VRDHFALKTGDVVDFYVNERERSVQLLFRNKSIFDSLEELKLPPSPHGHPVTIAEMDEAIGDYLAEKHERIGREWEERQAFEKWKRAREKMAGR
jgi:bifunctional DNA-binding transcriptional regulator/antitoxin component of YhaV-PrlF toxin-antitoxin module